MTGLPPSPVEIPIDLGAGTAMPMTIDVGATTTAPNRGLAESNLYTLEVGWTWPPGFGELWTRFRLVRSLDAEVMRMDEGATLIECRPDGYGAPVYVDLQPPPDRYCFYNAFLLNQHRVWIKAGVINHLGPGSYGWAYRLPSLLPGVSVSADQGILSQPDDAQTLVQFLQGPALFADLVVSYGQAVQRFWDPRRCPPPMMAALLTTLGFRFVGTLGLAQLREVAANLLAVPAGTWDYIAPFVAAVTGYPAEVYLSNNLMISQADSSFEDGTLNGTGWKPFAVMDYAAVLVTFEAYASLLTDRPTYADMMALPGGGWETAEVRGYEDYPSPVPTLPPNVLAKYFLYLNTATTIRCGAIDPIRYGIPVSSWVAARGAFYATSATGASVSLSLDLYDLYGTFLRTLVLVPPTVTTAAWTYYATPFDRARPINVDATVTDLAASMGSWLTGFTGYNQLLSYAPATGGGSDLTWQTIPNPGNPTALFARPLTALPGQQVVLRMTVAAPVTAVAWRPVIRTATATATVLHAGGWVSPTGAPQTISESVTVAATVTGVWAGIEVARPPVIANDYGRLRDQVYSYASTVSGFATYTALATAPANGGWPGAIPVAHHYATVPGYLDSYTGLAAEYANYAAISAVTFRPSLYPSGAGVHTLLAADGAVGLPNDQPAWYAVPVLTTSAAASVDLLVVDDG